MVTGKRIDALYIMKNNGILISCQKNGCSGDIKTSDDLVSSIITGIDIFSNEVFNGRIRYIAIDDGRKIYLKNIKFDADASIKVVVVTAKDFAESWFKDLDDKMIQVKWTMEPLKENIHRQCFDDTTIDSIKKKMVSIFFEMMS